MNTFKNWAIDTAFFLFDDSKNDLRALPKTVRLQILVVLSFVWSTVFTVYFFSMSTMIWGWVGLVIGHLGVVFATYYTFKTFHNARQHNFNFNTYHSLGRTRGMMVGRDKHGNPYRVDLPAGDPGGEHE